MQTAMWACQPVDVESMLWLLFFNWLSRTWPRKLSYFILFGDSQMAVSLFSVSPFQLSSLSQILNNSSFFAICLFASYSLSPFYNLSICYALFQLSSLSLILNVLSSLFAICLSISYSFPYFTTTHPFQLCFLSPNLNYLFSIVLLLVSIPHTPLPSFSL